MKSLISALLILTSAAVYAQEPKQFSLKEAQAYAVQHNYESQAAAIDLDIAKKKVSETRAIGLPQVNGTVGYQNFLDVPTQLIPAQAFNPNAGPDEFAAVQFGIEQNVSAGATASLLLFDGSYFVGLQAAKTYVLFSEKSKQKTETEVKEAVTSAYHTVIVAKENVKVLTESKKTADKIYKETRALYDNGFSESTDVSQIKLTVSNIENSLNQAKNQLETAEKMLKFQLGIKLEETILLTDSLSTLVDVSKTAEGMLEKDFNVNSHIDFQLATTGLELSKLSMKNGKAGYLPSLSTYLTHSQNAFSNEFAFLDSGTEWYPTTVWGVTLNVPIFTSFNKRFAIQQSKLEVDKSTLQQQQVQEGLKLQLQSARSNFAFALENYKNQEENLNLAKNIRQTTLTKYKEGVASSFELTQAENQLLTTQGQFISAALQLLQAKSDLDKALNIY